MHKTSKLAYILGSIAITTGLLIGVTYAAFTDKGKVLGSTFSAGSSDIKFLNDVTLGTESSNLTDELTGPSFSNISPTWTQDYLLKIFNNGTSNLALTTASYYETANDPQDLRSDIQVEIFPWNDTNSNGVVDSGEIGTALGKKTIIKWKTEGFDLGELQSGQQLPLIFRFTAPTLGDDQQGATAVFDFEFEAIQL
jgi:predicted ribosomally synthesized peptide with SipW-like signal peptide